MRMQLSLLAGLLVALCGCPGDLDLEDVLEEIEFDINRNVEVIQTVDPRTITLPPALITAGESVVLDAAVDVIVDVRGDLVVDVLPDITLLGFENLTGFDIYVRYLADDELQGIFVFDGETLLLEYPCLGSVELLSEDDFDPATGVLVDAFDFTESFFLNPEDFVCGEAVIFTFDPFAVTTDFTLIDLVR